MFNIKSYKTIAKRKNLYLSFPDIIQSRHNKSKFFLVYRSADNHHPTYSSLHLLSSENEGNTWKKVNRFDLTMRRNGRVWNCPRFSYFPDGSLNIICDTKDSTSEKEAEFKIYILKTFDEWMNYSIQNTGMRGMVPDRVIKFKNNLYCANHIVDNQNKTLTQLINHSTDNGKTWYDCNILARSPQVQPCEASLVSFFNQYLIAYIRNNKRSYVINEDGGIEPQKILKYITEDGINWWPCISPKIYGHRITANFYHPKKYPTSEDILLMSYRNTLEKCISVSSMKIDSRGEGESEIETIKIDDTAGSIYHCGYTGLAKCDSGDYLVAYYLQEDKMKKPFIKLCKFEHKNSSS